MMDKATLGARIREQRNIRKLSGDELSEKAEIGKSYLGEIERGERMPSLNTFIRIVNILGVSSDLLLRDAVDTAKPHVFNEITEGIKDLTPPQLRMVSDVVKSMTINFFRLEKNKDDLSDE